MANHLRLNLNLVELLSGVDTDDGTDHLWDDDHVTEVGLDEVWLLVWLSLLLCLAELLDEAHWLALETAVETTTGTGVDDVAELVRGEVEESNRENIGLANLLPFEFLMCMCFAVRGMRTARGRLHGRRTS